MFLFSGGQFSWQLGGLLSPRLKISSRVSENCYSYCKQIQIYKKVFVKQTVGLVFWLMVNLKLEFFKDNIELPKEMFETQISKFYPNFKFKNLG